MDKIKAALLLFWNKINNRTTIIVASILLVCCVGGIAAGIYFTSPEVVAAKAITKFAEDFAKRDDVSTLVNIVDGGSVEASVSSILWKYGLPWESEELLQDGAALSGKIYFSDNAVMLEKIKLGNKENSISLNAYLSDKLFYVKEDNILKGAYGAEYDTLAENFKNSIFAYESGSDYAITDKEAYDSIIKYLDNPISNEMKDEVEKIAKTYTKEIYKIIRENAVFESNNKEIEIGDDVFTAKVISIIITEENIEKSLREIYDYVKNDTSVINYIEKYEATFEIYLNYSDLAEDDDTLGAVEMYEKYIDELDESIDNIVKQMKEDKESQDICLEIITKKGSSTLTKSTINIGGKETFTLEIGADGIKKTNEMSIYAEDQEISYKIERNDQNGYTADLMVNLDKIFSIDIDLEKENFEVMYMINGDGATVSGSISSNNNITTIQANNIIIKETYCSNIFTGEMSEKTNQYETDLKIIINENDKIPSIPTDYKTIDKIKDEDVELWIKNIGNFIE